jgi:metalloendopeptidase OMA1, mitochondrial
MAFSTAVGAYAYSTMATVPVTERKAFRLFPLGFEKWLGKVVFDLVCEKAEEEERLVPADDPRVEAVERICRRLIEKSPEAARLHSFYDEWEFAVIEDQRVNAMVMPGGKVVVYSGILPVMKNEHGAATVLSHEIAHVVARHSGEKLSSFVYFMLTFFFPPIWRWLEPDGKSNNHSSKMREAEADAIGLDLMYHACYDPREAPKFWNRMAQLEEFSVQFGDGAVADDLKTHPASHVRQDALQRLVETKYADFEERCGRRLLKVWRTEMAWLKQKQVFGFMGNVLFDTGALKYANTKKKEANDARKLGGESGNGTPPPSPEEGSPK